MSPDLPWRLASMEGPPHRPSAEHLEVALQDLPPQTQAAEVVVLMLEKPLCRLEDSAYALQQRQGSEGVTNVT